MPVVGQTPGIFVKAGAAGFVFSPACVVALAKIGLTPEDFGTYKDVRAQQEAARAKCKAWDDYQADPKGKKPEKPTDHERFVGNSEAGHLTQNATQQRKRGDACSNATPGYSDEGAPCGPHAGAARTPGTEHYLVTRQEQGQRPKSEAQPGTPADAQSYPPQQRAADDAKRGQDVQGTIANNNKKYPKQLKAARNDPDQKKAAAAFKKMQAERKKAADEVQKDPKYSKARAAADPKALKKVDADTEGKLAAECIEAFRRAGMREMKKRAADPKAIRAAEEQAAKGAQPSAPGSKKTNQQVADEDLVKARAREKKARKDAKGLPADDPKKFAAARAQRDREQAEKDANQYRDADCRAKQGKTLDPKTGDAKNGKDPETVDGLTGGFGSKPSAKPTQRSGSKSSGQGTK